MLTIVWHLYYASAVKHATLFYAINMPVKLTLLLVFFFITEKPFKNLIQLYTGSLYNHLQHFERSKTERIYKKNTK